MARRRRRRKARRPAVVSAEDFRRLQAMAAAAVRAYETLNSYRTREDLDMVAWDLWRAIDGGVPPVLH